MSKLTAEEIQAAGVMLQDYYKLLPHLYGETNCTLNAHCLTHLAMYIRIWDPLWKHSLFGYESMNGHITSTIHSKRKLESSFYFPYIDVRQTVGNLAIGLLVSKTKQTFLFIAPLSTSFAHQ